jgi:hypothetical protein
MKGIIFPEEYFEIQRVPVLSLFESFLQMCALLKVDSFVFQAVRFRAWDA